MDTKHSPPRDDSDTSSASSSNQRGTDPSFPLRTSSTFAAISPATAKQSPPNEITPIVSADNGRRDYQTSQPASTARDVTANPPETTTGVRHRNPQYQETGTRRSGARVENDGADNEDDSSWWKRMADKYGSVELDNKGSTARDHLALERTFLAWLRTSLAFASIGIAITQLFRLNSTIAPSGSSTSSHSSPDIFSSPEAIAATRLRHVGKPLGATFIGISIVVLFIGFHRYFESQHWVIRGKFPASRGSIALITFIAAALIVTSLVVVVSIAPKAIRK